MTEVVFLRCVSSVHVALAYVLSVSGLSLC